MPGRLANSFTILIAPPRWFRFFSGMSKLRMLLKYWLPVTIWMVIIFSASADSQSYQHSSLLFEPLLHWLFPKMPETQVAAIHHIFASAAT